MTLHPPTGPGATQYTRRQLPIPTPRPSHHTQSDVVQLPPLASTHSDGPPPVPARPGHPEHAGLVHKSLSSQDLPTLSESGNMAPFPVPPPPPPLPPRQHTSNISMPLGYVPPPPPLPSPPLAHQPHAAHLAHHAVGHHPHELHKPHSQLSLKPNPLPSPPNPVLGRQQETPSQSHASLAPEEGQQRKAEEGLAKEEERWKEEQLRKDMERMRLERDEAEKKRVEEERRRQEMERQAEEERQIQAELERQEELARQKTAEEEERKRKELEARLREQWEEEERLRRIEKDREERERLDAERARWVAEELERIEQLKREMEDKRVAALESLREEMEAERIKKEKEERAKASEELARVEAEKMRAIEERNRKAKMLQEDEDAAIALRLQQSEEEERERERMMKATPPPPVDSPSGPKNNLARPDAELPNYDRWQPSPPPEPSIHTPSPGGGRPHANTVHSISPHVSPPMHPQPIQPPVHHSTFPPAHPLAHTQMHIPPSDTKDHSQAHPPEGRSSPSNPSHGSYPTNNFSPQPTNQTDPFPPIRTAGGFPHLGTPGPMPSQASGRDSTHFRNSLSPHELERFSPPVQNPLPQQQHRPNKLVRQSASLGGSNPTKANNPRPGPGQGSNGPLGVGIGRGNPPGSHTLPPVQTNQGGITTPSPGGTVPGPMGTTPHGHPGSVSASAPSSATLTNGSGRPSTSNGRFASSDTETPGAGPSSQAVAGGSTGPSLITNFPEYRGPSEPLCGIVHGYGRPVIRNQDLPAPAPVRDVLIMEPEPSPPFHIVAHTWKNLLKFIASQNACRIEPSPAALAREKHGPPNLRVVMHFVKLPVPTAEWRIILYLALQSITPPPEGYPKNDTSVVPYLFPSPEPGRPLANNPDTQIYTIPTMPLPVLPLALPNLAPYLQAALEESQRCSDSRARLSKLVNATTQAAMTAQSHSSVPQVIAPMLSTIAPNERTRMGQEPVRIQQENSSGSKGGFFSRVFKPKGSNHKGKGLNDGMYDIVTPYNMEYQ